MSEIEFIRLVKPLEPPDTHHLAAAEGWLELGVPGEAQAELERISTTHRSHPDVLELRWKLLAHAGQWRACVDEAAALVKSAPKRPDGWIHRSYALHELKQTAEAYALLLTVVENFPKNWLMRYNLACYACQLGKTQEALDWLEAAMKLSDRKSVKLMALADLDLKSLWESIAEG